MKGIFMYDNELLHLIKTKDKDEIESLFAQARKIRETHYGKSVFIRGLIEITNYCKNDCYYCGIRCSNKKLERYRLSLETILDCCRTGENLGIKTFVLQGGEDPWFTAERVTEIVSVIRKEFTHHAITLSLGERSAADLEKFFCAGSNRYLLRHETACDDHYAKIHPASQTLSSRKSTLQTLKKIGYSVGSGFMVGTPGQSYESLLADLRYLEELQPQMVGIGPFLPQKDTPFGNEAPGNLNLCLKMTALTRILLPLSLIPATTAMETIAPNGRELALNAGANVVMPNLTPVPEKKLYAIYDNKTSIESEAAESFNNIKEKIISAGYKPDMSRADAITKQG